MHMENEGVYECNKHYIHRYIVSISLFKQFKTKPDTGVYIYIQHIREYAVLKQRDKQKTKQYTQSHASRAI